MRLNFDAVALDINRISLGGADGERGQTSLRDESFPPAIQGLIRVGRASPLAGHRSAMILVPSGPDGRGLGRMGET